MEGKKGPASSPSIAFLVAPKKVRDENCKKKEKQREKEEKGKGHRGHTHPFNHAVTMAPLRPHPDQIRPDQTHPATPFTFFPTKSSDS